MKKKFDRLFNTKTTGYNSDKQVGLGEKTSRRSELAKKAIEAICNNRPSVYPAASNVDTPVIPIQEIQPTFRIDTGKEADAESALLTICECCNKDGFRKNILVKIDSGQFLCPSCLQAMRSFKS